MPLELVCWGVLYGANKTLDSAFMQYYICPKKGEPMENGVAEFKVRLQEELVQLKARCTTIDTLLRSLDDYEHPKFAVHPAATTPENRKTVDRRFSAEGPSVMDRTKRALETIPSPFVLVDLKRHVEKDGLGEIGRGNWGVVVQKLKKKGLMTCCGGEEGKTGALYQAAQKSLIEPSPVESLF